MADQTTEEIINSSLDSLLGSDTNPNNSTTGQADNAQDEIDSGRTETDNPQTADGQSPPTRDVGRADNTSNAVNDRRQTQQDGQGQPTPQAARPGRVRDDGQGNLVDDAGRIVAARGAERRWYNEAQAAGRQTRQAQRELGEMRSELEALRGKVQPYEQAFSTFANLQMQPQEVAVGAQLYKSFRTNPRETIEYLITEARKNGVTIEMGGGALDIGAVRSTVLEALKPILDERAERAKAAEQDAAADREYTAFMQDEDYPHAAIHENEIAALMRMNPRLDMRQAYLRLEAESIRSGLDFSQPLRPQWDAKKVAATNSGTTTGQVPSAPLPGGRTSSSATKVGSTRIAAPNTSNSDIVRAALREAGLS